MTCGVGPDSPRRSVPARWGYPFWEVVRDFAEQGLNRRQVAEAIGYTKVHFYRLLADNPDKDPFEPYGVVANYVRDTGEGFREALERMAAAGYIISRAAREIGFTHKRSLRYAMRVRGIDVKFRTSLKGVPRLREDL